MFHLHGLEAEPREGGKAEESLGPGINRVTDTPPPQTGTAHSDIYVYVYVYRTELTAERLSGFLRALKAALRTVPSNLSSGFSPAGW